MLQIFYRELRTKDGFEYEPESLKSMLAALDRYLKEHDYKYSIIRDREFYQSNLVLEGKVMCLRQQGKGKRSNAPNALTTEEEEIPWSKQSKSQQLQFKSSFPNYVVDLDSTFRPEGKTRTPMNGSRGLQFLCGLQWH